MKAVLPWVKVFLMGYVSVLMAHQGVLAALHALQVVPVSAYNLSPVPPFGIPAVVSSAFFGGVWALPLWALLRRHHGPRLFLGALAFGAVLPTLVAMLVVFPLKGLAVVPMTWLIGALLNGAWGLGVVLLMWLFGSGPNPSDRAAA